MTHRGPFLLLTFCDSLVTVTVSLAFRSSNIVIEVVLRDHFLQKVSRTNSNWRK